MKKELIERLLNEQATPEEEHLITQMLQQEEDMDSWLTEDETAEYDRIVSNRQRKHRYLRWAVAAMVAIVLAAGATVLWLKQETMPLVATSNAIQEPKPIPATEDTIIVVQQHPIAKPKRNHTIKSRQVTKQASTVDSLQYYIARLEKELESVNESTYTAKAEEVLRADARLQKLVQRIMVGELTKDDVPAEALNMNQTKEEQP